MGRWIHGAASESSMAAALSLDGYASVELLRATERSRVYAAIRERDERKVLAKVYRNAGDPGREARVEHELRLIQGLRGDQVVRALTLEHSGDDLVLILDWIEGEDLARYCDGRPLGLDEFYAIATQIARILAKVHDQRVIHRDIKPTNILLRAGTGEVVLADFGISVLLEAERAHINDPDVVEGTLPYISPEQSGRTSASVDFRTDLYSLGVTFYELLTGQRPFRGESSLELLHAHLARRPDPPQWLRAPIPTPLSELVMKLLEKAPERRYQSAVGLLADLERLARIQGQAHAGAGELGDFELGRDDLPIELALPHRLYGRDAERARLLDSFRATSTGQPRMVLICGPAGVGKSALLDELVEPVLGRRGFIARGKFDRGKEQPFAALIDAISGVADQLLIETDERLSLWRARLREGLGGLAGLSVALVPKLGPILGEVEDDVAALGVTKASHRVALTFTRLFATLAQPEHPLVLGLDDLQWADPASCEVIDTLLSTQDLAILVVGTTRERRALEPGHGLRELLASLASRESDPELIELQPLTSAALAELVADVLAKPPAQVESLVAIIGRKTGRNPFFVRQFLLQLTELQLLRPAPEGWTWDPAAIEAAALPEDSVEMMTAKIARLDARAQRLLAVAAVAGGRFGAGLIAAVVGRDGPGGGRALERRALELELQVLVDEGLIAHAGDEFVFGHERVRDAAYTLCDRDETRSLHLAIGRELAAGVDAEASPARVFEIADHLDRGYGLMALADQHGTGAVSCVSTIQGRLSPRDASELVELNLRAGRRALDSGAARTALRYLEIVEALLDDIPDPRAGLRFEAELALAQAAGLSGDHERADALSAAVLARELSPGDFAEASVQRCMLLVIAGDRSRALRDGLAALAKLGESVAEAPPPRVIVASLLSLMRNLGSARLAAIEAAPSIEEPRLLAAMEVFVALRNIAYTVRPQTWLVLAAPQIDRFPRHGSHPSMPLALTQGGLVLANVRGQRVRARALAARCVELDVANPRRHELLLLQQFVILWLARWREQVPTLRRIGRLAHEAGDFENATFSALMEISLSFYGGVHLRLVEASIGQTLAQVTTWGTLEMFGLGRSLLHYCAILMVPSPSAEALEVFEDAAMEVVDRDAAQLARADSQLSAAFVACVLGDHRRALELVEGCGPLLERAMPGTWVIPMVRLLGPLAAAGCLRGPSPATGVERRRLRRRLRHGAAQLRRLTESGCNFGHYAALLQGECHAVDGELERAGVEFERARALAEAEHHPVFEALACERLAEIAEQRGLASWMVGPARRSVERYRHWGAQAKVAQLEARWPWLVTPAIEASAQSVRAPVSSSASVVSSASISSSSTSNRALDVATIFKTWQAISADIRLDEVVDRVMRIAVENAGAERGALILRADQARGLELAAEIEAAGASGAEARVDLGQALELAQVGDRVPVTLLRWVARTREPVVLAEARDDLRFVGDAYIQASDARSILCLPIVKHERLVGLLYLENRQSRGSFTAERLEVLQMLMSHAASALEHARLYEALRTSELRWRLLVDRLPDVVALLDRDAAIEFINLPLDAPARRDVLGRSVLDFFAAEHRAALEAELARATAPGPDTREPSELELEAQLGGGEPRWYSVRVVPIVVDARLERIIVVATDTTERRQRAQERLALEAQLNQQQRLESIGTLAAGVAHEINNPIQGIMSYAELIVREEPGELIQEFAGEIEHESKRVATIVRNLLAFSRQEREQSLAFVEVAKIVDETLSLVRTILRRDQIGLDVVIEDGLPKVCCRSQQIQQVIMNLVTNARDALNARFPTYHDDKRIELRAERFEHEGADWVRIRVEDRGGGVPEDLVERIFDPFFTTKGRDQGTGLGLSVSHGILRDHGGHFRLHNQPGGGACFMLELPAA